VPKTALAGVILEIFSARFVASMAAFKEEIEPSRPFGRWDLVVMVEAQGSCKKAVQRADREEEQAQPGFAPAQFSANR